LIGLACFQLVFGLAYLIWVLGGNAYQGHNPTGRLATRLFAPIGLWLMLGGAFALLNGRVLDTPLIALAALSFAAIAVWALRIRRTFNAHVREQSGDKSI
jgi:hypothetical protein